VPHVGNGPCVLAELDERHALLAPSPTWHGRRGNVREVDLEFATAIDLTEAWQSGRYDALLLGVSPVGDAPDTIAESSLWLGTNFVGFQARRPPFDDPRVRRAFAHALDRERLSETTGWIDDGAGGGGLVPPAMPGHSHRVAPEYDLDRARRLLAEAGYPGGQGLTEIKVVAPENDARAMFDHELAEQLAAVGVRAQFTYVPTVAIPDALEQDADACVWGFNADYPDPSGMLYSVMTLAPTFYRDSEIEALLERARSLRDQDERLRMYREVERLWIGEQAAIVPYQYSRRLTLRRPWIEGLWLHGLGSSTLAEVVVRPELRP
jgi:ABC-type transport system substrate-binding protein